MQRLLLNLIFVWAAFSVVSCADNKSEVSSAYPVNSPATNSRPNPNFEIPLNLSGLATVGRGNVKVNPEHGKPGHDCNLPVGSPLNSTSTSGKAAAQKNLALPLQPVSETTASGGPNPAHGKPGHRCDIAVGAPLNSRPPSTPAPAPAPKTEVEALPGMNPAHGKPGHRCDIAVGAPLTPQK